MKRLKPCPFCGETEIEIVRNSIGKLHWCVCRGCKADGPCGIDENEAVDLWNRRDGDSVKPANQQETDEHDN